MEMMRSHKKEKEEMIADLQEQIRRLLSASKYVSLEGNRLMGDTCSLIFDLVLRLVLPKRIRTDNW